jgi:hypothetical protein
MSKVFIPFRDYDNEASTVSVPVDPGFTEAEAQTLRDAIDALTLGAAGNGKLISETDLTGGTVGKASDENAQRERKWLVRGVTPGGFARTIEIPCALATLLSTDSKFLNVGSGPGATFVTALEVGWWDPQSGGFVTFVNAELVGRAT